MEVQNARIFVDRRLMQEGAQEIDGRGWTFAWIAAAWAIFVTDLLSPGVNLGMAYVLALAVLLLASGRSSIWRPALVMSACVLLGYFLKPNSVDGFFERLFHPRFLNRSMIVVVLLATAALAPRLRSGLDPRLWQRSAVPEGGIGEEALFLSLARSLAGIASVALLIGTLVLDVVTPVAVNGTNLLPITLLLAVQTANRRLMRWLLPALVVLPALALATKWLTSPDLVAPYMLLNRSIAALATAVLALALLRTVSRVDAEPDPPSWPGPATPLRGR